MDPLTEEELADLKYLYYSKEPMSSLNMELLFRTAECYHAGERQLDRMFTELCNYKDKLDKIRTIVVDPKPKRRKVG